MKILVLAPQPFFQYRGTPIAVRELVTTLAASDFSVDLLTYHEGDDVSIDNCRHYRHPRLPLVKNIPPGLSWQKIPCDTAMFLSAARLLFRNRYDLIHAVEESVLISMILSPIFGTAYVYDMDSSLPMQINENGRVPGWIVRVLESMERLAIRRSLGVVAVCKSLEETARRCDPDKPIARLEDISLLDQSEPCDEWLRSELNLSGPILMYVGNLQPYQGIDLLLESQQCLMRTDPDATLVIIGGQQQDIDRYRQQAAERGISGCTYFLGPRPATQLGHFIGQADVLISPRISGNNTPMKIYSYLDSGKPVVATRLSTHTQVMDDKIACLVAPDGASMAAGIRRLLHHPALADRLSAAAKRRVCQEYSRDAFGRKLLDFYSQLETRLSVRCQSVR